MNGLQNYSYRKMALVLFLLLSVQLTGLTCIQDLWAYPIWSSGPVSIAILPIDSPDDDSDSAPLPRQETFSDGCPCHYVMTFLPGMTWSAAPYSGELPMLDSSPVKDNLPASIFHPPIILF